MHAKLMKLADAAEEVSDCESVEPEKKRPKMDDDDWLTDVMAGPSTAPLPLVTNEVQRYLMEPQIHQRDDPLSWWASKDVAYPCVAALARHILAVPASSVPSERIFSLAGNIVTNKRTKLSPENVDSLIFLAKNLP